MDFFGILFDVKNGSKMPYSKNYFDTLFAAKLEELGVKTLTGTLPLTFTTKAGNAVGWSISGNDNVENLIVSTFFGNINTSGKIISHTDYKLSYFPVEQGKTYKIGVDIPQSYVWAFFTEVPTIGSVSNNGSRYVKNSSTYIEITADITGYCVMRSEGNYTGDIIGGTVGVGQRTKNLFDVSDFSLVKVTPTAYRYGTIIGILPQGIYTLTATKAASAQYVYLTMVRNGTYTFEQITNVPYTFTADGVSRYILRIADQAEYDSWAQFGYTKIMLVEGSAAPANFVPYGYEIPLTISQDGQTDKTYDIYIGDSPLTEGETISKQSTGQDIELFEGINTLDTTLYNKPQMTITYKGG